MSSVPYPAKDGSLPRNWDLSPPATARSIIDEFKHQMESGLAADRSGSLAMIRTFIPKTARFHPGTYVGLDMSGTNFRVVVLSVNPDQTLAGHPRIRIFPIPSRLKYGKAGREAHSRDLFRFLAAGIAQTLEEKGIAASGLRVGFTFAFPTRMESADRGVLLKWTKEWDLPDLVGRDPVPELARACRQAGLQGVKVNVLLNDTVGTLILGYFRDRRTLAGGILGTGTNLAAWLGSTAINFECGNFDFGPLQDRILTPVDRDLDSRSRNPGQQRFEKMVAGRYLGGLLRRLLAGTHPSGRFGERDSVDAEDLSRLAADSGDLPETRRFLERLGVEGKSRGAAATGGLSGPHDTETVGPAQCAGHDRHGGMGRSGTGGSPPDDRGRLPVRARSRLSRGHAPDVPKCPRFPRRSDRMPSGQGRIRNRRRPGLLCRGSQGDGLNERGNLSRNHRLTPGGDAWRS